MSSSKSKQVEPSPKDSSKMKVTSSSYQTSVSGSSKTKTRVQVTKTIQKRMPDGKIVTETTTEFQEVDDAADFADFGLSDDPAKVTASLASLQTTALKNKKPATTTTTSTTTTTPSKTKAVAAKRDSSSSSSRSSSSEDEAGEKFAQEALEAHNAYRKKHGVKPLKLNKKLCSFAQEWASKLAKEDKFEHRPNVDYGENIYCSWSSNPNAKVSGSVPVDSWYSEIGKHPFGEEPKTMGSGHFTQVVWKASKELGVGKARSKTGKVIVVANYDPAGNYVGKYVENVMPPKA